MSERDKIQLFEDRKIRTAWDAEAEEWYFSVVDVIQVLTDSADPKQYIKKMRSRDPELSSKWGTICTLVEIVAADGKKRKLQAANVEGLLRIIQRSSNVVRQETGAASTSVGTASRSGTSVPHPGPAGTGNGTSAQGTAKQRGPNPVRQERQGGQFRKQAPFQRDAAPARPGRDRRFPPPEGLSRKAALPLFTPAPQEQAVRPRKRRPGQDIRPPARSGRNSGRLPLPPGPWQRAAPQVSIPASREQ